MLVLGSSRFCYVDPFLRACTSSSASEYKLNHKLSWLDANLQGFSAIFEVLVVH
jgi:hypothetical protein